MTGKTTLRRELAKLIKIYGIRELSDILLKKRKSRKGRAASKARAPSKSATRAAKAKSAHLSKHKSRVRPKRSRASALLSRKKYHPKVSTKDAQSKTGSSIGNIVQERLPLKKVVDTAHRGGESKKKGSAPLARGPNSMWEDRGEDYAKWFRMISGKAIEMGLRDPDSESLSPMRGKSAWKEAINQLRIRELLLSGPFRLIGYSPDTSVIVSFLPDGGVGKGQSPSVASWRLTTDRLELLDATGGVYAQFLLSGDGRSLVEISNASAHSAKPSQLVRVATKR